MIHETYETLLLDGMGLAVALGNDQVWRVTKTEIHVSEEDGQRLILTVHWVVAG